MSPLWQRSAAGLARAMRHGETDAVAVATCFLDRVREHDPELGAFLGVSPERVLREAAAVDAARRAGQHMGALAGVPIAWKDNLVRRGEHATAGSRLLESFVSPYSATVLERLEGSGAVLLGRTNLDEFGMGSTTENSAYGPTCNPWDHDLVPGGSSGGAAAAVAADLCPLAVGSDTGGSVRQPAAFCGVSGLKPTYGRVSRHGLIAYASSFDCVGALARDVTDLALWLATVEGTDERDATSRAAPRPLQLPAAPPADLAGLRIGLPQELNGTGIEPAVAAAVTDAADTFAALGAAVDECSLPMVEQAVPAYYLLATAEASSNLARYDGVRYGLRRGADGPLAAMTTSSRSAGLGEEVQLRILLGTFALQALYQDEFYVRACRVRERLRADLARAFTEFDLLLCPTSPVPPFPRGRHRSDPLALYLGDALTVPASLAGIPALSLPGQASAGRPIGLQLMAPAFAEQRLLAVAGLFQRHTDHHLGRPLP